MGGGLGDVGGSALPPAGETPGEFGPPPGDVGGEAEPPADISTGDTGSALPPS